MRLCMTDDYWAKRMVPGPPNGKSQEGRGGWAGRWWRGGLGSRRVRKRPIRGSQRIAGQR
ncbi:hypothetical protein GT037_008804 [Alternaria burnsii]|uniref:Uncharacterized protein n=1 Tax=Alternaria burnsii TaxID=1187904 RepID=A0A8H7EAS1_9PLEO|nr:uncharacterized protein GT037_011263 [Alternaria burnsii]XP_038783816.1 uncharacterized protein GT037_008804 [Alternaria burnsii]KAF7670684.1 hypothetical protein GT037_011263 [Alternaria burnsii]KAF7673481.1 hypothetical protein GT037_008804 [Alternaria burnsii]